MHGFFRVLLYSQSMKLRDPHWDAAGRLLQSRGVPLRDHVLLRENLATYLTHLDQVDVSPQALVSPGGWRSERWTQKLERDLARPYTDEQVWSHVNKLDAELRSTLQSLVVGMERPYPLKVYVQGSLMRGRLGQNSDLDGQLETRHPLVLQRGREAFLAQAEDGIQLVPLSAERPLFNAGMRILGGARQELSAEDVIYHEGRLSELYRERLEEKGLRLSDGVDGVQVERVGPAPDRREVCGWFERVTEVVWPEQLSPAQKLEKLEDDSFKSWLRRTTTASVAALAQAGPLGPAVTWAVDQVIDQG